MKNLSLRNKLMVITSGLIVVSLVVLAVISIRNFAKDKTTSVTEQTKDMAKLIGEKVKTEINTRVETIKTIDRLGLANQAAGRPKRGQKKAMPDSSAMAGGLLRISRFNYNGLAVTRSGKRDSAEPMKKLELTPEAFDRDEVKIAEKLKVVFKGQTLLLGRNQAFSKPIWLMAFPVVEGEIAKYILVAYLSSEILDSAFTSQQFSGFIVDTDRNTVVHSEKKETLSGRNVKEHPGVSFADRQQTRVGFNKYIDVTSRTEYFGAFTKIDFGDCIIIVEIKTEVALETVARTRIEAALIAGIIILIALLLVYFFAKTISEPIRELKLAADKIKAGDYNLRLTPKSGDEVGALTQAFNDMAVGLEEREKLKGALGKFVNPEIAEKAMKGELKLGGERRTATIFFSDIRSFTAISEKLEPEEVVEFLNAYMTIMVKIIGDHHGIVDKFIGDAIMAVWGVPESKGNDALNAVNATVEMRRALLEFNKGRGSAKKPVIKIGSGLNTGAVLAGQIGSEDRLDYTVIGDAVNLASRVETLNKPFGTDILISEDTYQIVKSEFDCEPMQKIKVKGKSEPQQIYAVLRKKSDKNGPKTLQELRNLLGIDMKGKPTKSGDDEEVKYEILEK